MILFFELELEETWEIIWPQLTIFKRKSKILPKSKVVWDEAVFAVKSQIPHSKPMLLPQAIPQEITA